MMFFQAHPLVLAVGIPVFKPDNKLDFRLVKYKAYSEQAPDVYYAQAAHFHVMADYLFALAYKNTAGALAHFNDVVCNQHMPAFYKLHCAFGFSYAGVSYKKNSQPVDAHQHPV